MLVYRKCSMFTLRHAEHAAVFLLLSSQAGLQDVLAQALEAGVEVESQQLRQLVRQLQQVRPADGL